MAPTPKYRNDKEGKAARVASQQKYRKKEFTKMMKKIDLKDQSSEFTRVADKNEPGSTYGTFGKKNILKMATELKDHGIVTGNSKILDVGSGFMHSILYLQQSINCPVIGVEANANHYLGGLKTLMELAEKRNKMKKDKFPPVKTHRISADTVLKDAMDLKSLGGANVLFTFLRGAPKSVMEHLAKLFNASPDTKFLICSKDMEGKSANDLGFDVDEEPVINFGCFTLQGSTNASTMLLYQKKEGGVPKETKQERTDFLKDMFNNLFVKRSKPRQNTIGAQVEELKLRFDQEMAELLKTKKRATTPIERLTYNRF